MSGSLQSHFLRRDFQSYSKQASIQSGKAHLKTLGEHRIKYRALDAPSMPQRGKGISAARPQGSLAYQWQRNDEGVAIASTLKIG